nr:hypothetical protein [Tanacetum cinerariifolium]
MTRISRHGLGWSTLSPLPTTETSNIPPTIPDFASIFKVNDKVLVLEKAVAKLKNDPLHTQVTMITKQVRNQLPLILLEEVSNFASPVIEKMIQESLNQVNLAKASSQPQSTYEAATTLIEFELKKILIDKMNSSESYLTAPEHWECYDGLVKSYNLDNDFFSSYDVYSLKRSRDDKDKDEGPSAGSDKGSSKGTKSQPKSSGKSVHAEEPEFEVGDTDTPQGQEGDHGKDKENPEGNDYPFDLSKPLPLITHGNRQSVPVEFFINNDLKYLQGGVSTMTYTASTTKTKAAQYDLPGIEDMVPNIWSPVKVAYDKHALWGISHWRDQRKTFYAYARGIQSRGDDYSSKRILAVTHVSVMRKHGYGYLEKIMVRRADNKLYKFKEGDFPRLRINDIKDMLLLVVQNQLTNLSGDDVADFAIALRMLTRSLVIKKRVEDLQLGVESYQKQINVTKPDTTRPDLRKKTRILHSKTLKDSYISTTTTRGTG